MVKWPLTPSLPVRGLTFIYFLVTYPFAVDSAVARGHGCQHVRLNMSVKRSL